MQTLLSFVLVAWCAGAADEPTLGKKGKLLLEERFAGATLAPAWSVKTGKVRVADGILRAAQTKEDGQLCLFSCVQPMQDAAVQIDFKFDGARGLNIGVNPAPGELNRKGHLFSLMITPRMWNITEHHDRSQRNSRTVLVSAPEQFQPGQWYTLLLEARGEEVCASIAGKKPLRARSKVFAVKKPGLEFRVAGPDQAEASFANLRVWELK